MCVCVCVCVCVCCCCCCCCFWLVGFSLHCVPMAKSTTNYLKSPFICLLLVHFNSTSHEPAKRTYHLCGVERRSGISTPAGRTSLGREVVGISSRFVTCRQPSTFHNRLRLSPNTPPYCTTEEQGLLVRAPDSWSKGCEFESRQERLEKFSSSELTLCADSFSMSVPPPCYRSGM